MIGGLGIWFALGVGLLWLQVVNSVGVISFTVWFCLIAAGLFMVLCCLIGWAWGCVYLVWVDCLLWMNLPGCVSCVLFVGLVGLMVVGCCCLQVC